MGYNDPTIANRMHDFRCAFRQANPDLTALIQIVLYVGRPPLDMPDSIAEEDLSFHFRLVDIRQFTATHVTGDSPVVDSLFGVLCSGGDNPEYVRTTLQRIAMLESDGERRDALQKLLVIS